MKQYCRLGNNTSKCFDCFNIVGGFLAARGGRLFVQL